MTSKKIFVGLCGVAGSGKDYTFGMIHQRFPEAKRISFAGPLKSILVATDPIIISTPSERSRLSDILFDMSFESAKREYPEVRRLLQTLGTDGIRNVLGQDVWADAALAKARRGGPFSVFTDVRFANEANAIRAGGGVIIRVTRPTSRALFGELGAHSSERNMDDIHADFEFVNDGTSKNTIALMEFVQAAMRADVSQ